jgi:hypothetical protein
MVGSPRLFVHKPDGYVLRPCIDYCHFNDYTKKDKTPLPIMEELSAQVKKATHMTNVDSQSGIHLIKIPLGHEKDTTFRTKFGLNAYLVMPFGLYNAPATFQRRLTETYDVCWD